jgi:hypothetical protein
MINKENLEKLGPAKEESGTKRTVIEKLTLS